MVSEGDRVDVGVGRAVAVDAAAVAEQLEEGCELRLVRARVRVRVRG